MTGEDDYSVMEARAIRFFFKVHPVKTEQQERPIFGGRLFYLFLCS